MRVAATAAVSVDLHEGVAVDGLTRVDGVSLDGGAGGQGRAEDQLGKHDDDGGGGGVKGGLTTTTCAFRHTRARLTHAEGCVSWSREMCFGLGGLKTHNSGLEIEREIG